MWKAAVKSELINHHFRGNVSVGVKVQLHAILTLTLDGGKWSV